MTAVDTNILVRWMTGDDAEQTAAARAIFAKGSVWISKTVLLETAWVLRKTYKFEETSVVNAFVALLGLDHVHAEDEPAVTAALHLTQHGLAFEDAIHLSSRPAGAEFVSFDRALVRPATRAGVSGVSMVPPA